MRVTLRELVYILSKAKQTQKVKSYIFYSNDFKSLDGGFVEGYISTGDKDLVNDIITPNCLIDMLSQLQDRTIKLDVEHESFKGRGVERELSKAKIPIGKITDASLDRKGIKVKSELNPHHSRFNEVKNSIKDGFLDAFSIAFVPVEKITKMVNGSQVRLLEKVNLLNVAFTGNPCNTEAQITSVMLKSLDDEDNNLKESGGNSMTEEEAVKETVEEKPVDEVKPVEEKPAEKPVPEAEKEEVPDENVEAKSLAIQVKELTEQVAELKSTPKKEDFGERLKSIEEGMKSINEVVSSPQFKARAENMKAVLKAEEPEKKEISLISRLG